MRQTTIAPASALLVLLCAATASAQVVITLDVPAERRAFSGRDCRLAEPPQLSFDWSTESDPVDQEQEVFISDKSDCSTNRLSLVAKSARTTRTQSFPGTSSRRVSARDLFDLVSTDCGGAEGVESEVFVCVRITSTGGTDAVRREQAIDLDSKPPPVPTNVSADGLERGLLVRWELPDDTDVVRFAVEVLESGATDPVRQIFDGAGIREARVRSLENGVTYEVRVAAIDGAGSTARPDSYGNVSALSEPASGTPQDVEDFYERYRRFGGTETGGCAQAGAPAALLSLLPLAFVFRRRRRARTSLAAGALLLCLAAAPPALAQGPEEEPDILLVQSPQPIRSPQYYWLDVRIGAYLPEVDSEPALRAAGATPFKDVFGDSVRVLARLEFGVDVFQGFGRLGIGGAAGFWSADGRARLADDSRALDEVSFTVIPLTPLLNYRADFVHRLWSIPVVPYGKVGYGFAHWVSRTSGFLSRVEGGVAEGWARGFEWAAGLQLILDAFDTQAAASLDQDFGINRTGLFFELYGVHWRGAHGLRLRDPLNWAAGLHLAF